MLKHINKLLVGVFILTVVAPSITVRAEVSISTLVLSEVKIRYDSSSGVDYDEFIELHNLSADPARLDNYVLEYFNATNPSLTQQPIQKVIGDKLLAPGEQLVLARQPHQIENSILLPFSSLSDSGGRLRLVTTEGEIVDEIAWTNTQGLAVASTPSVVLYQCNNSTLVCNENRVQSFSRVADETSVYVQEGQTWQLSAAQPISSQLAEITVISNEGDPVQEDQDPIPPVSCAGVILSELLPNPSGSDAGKEFIELYNPTSSIISLENCSLQVSGSSRVYAFGPVSMSPGSYIAFYSNVTQLTLPNASGGTVWLLGVNDELHSMVYPGGIEDDAAWASINGIHQVTFQQTPSEANLSVPFKPCEPNEIRNMTSGECEPTAKEAVSSLVSCKAGQERNPETNRCRTILGSTVSRLTPCKAGQERSLETNRCRTVLAASTLADCEEGQERNPETNRCRKISSLADGKLVSVKDVKAPLNATNPTWWAVGGVILIAVGYAFYEWRQEIMVVSKRVLTKLHLKP